MWTLAAIHFRNFLLLVDNASHHLVNEQAKATVVKQWSKLVRSH